MRKFNPSLKFSLLGFSLPWAVGLSLSAYNSLFGINVHGLFAPVLLLPILLLVPILSLVLLIYGLALSIREPEGGFRWTRRATRHMCTLLLGLYLGLGIAAFTYAAFA
jgi:Ca2+/Na+ antiporter